MINRAVFLFVVSFNLVGAVLLLLQFTATEHWYDLCAALVAILAVIWFAMDERED